MFCPTVWLNQVIYSFHPSTYIAVSWRTLWRHWTGKVEDLLSAIRSFNEKAWRNLRQVYLMAPPNKESHQADLLWWCTESCWTLCVVASQDHHYKPPWHPQKFWVSEGNWWVNGEFPPNLCTFLCMAVKIHFFLSHLDYFHKNCRDFSVELCECFPQDISDMEKGYHGRWDVNFLGNYCWCRKRDVESTQHKRKSLKRSFINE